MNIYLNKYLNKDFQCSFSLNKIEGGKSILNLINQNILILSDTKSLNIESLVNRPCISFIISNMVDNGDYDYDDNYIPNIEEEYSYLEIFYCPITGEKINFIIENEIDNTNEIIKLEQELNNIKKMRKSKKKNDLEQDILNQINNLQKSNFGYYKFK